jgi:hypothetical protein
MVYEYSEQTGFYPTRSTRNTTVISKRFGFPG